MRTVRLKVHWEPEGWWSESEDLPGFTAFADTFYQLLQVATDAAAVEAGEPVSVFVDQPVSMMCDRSRSQTENPMSSAAVRTELLINA